jgi:hypothetical protein
MEHPERPDLVPLDQWFETMIEEKEEKKEEDDGLK